MILFMPFFMILFVITFKTVLNCAPAAPRPRPPCRRTAPLCTCQGPLTGRRSDHPEIRFKIEIEIEIEMQFGYERLDFTCDQPLANGYPFSATWSNCGTQLKSKYGII